MISNVLAEEEASEPGTGVVACTTCGVSEYYRTQWALKKLNVTHLTHDRRVTYLARRTIRARKKIP
jgi:hypothetical protein